MAHPRHWNWRQLFPNLDLTPALVEAQELASSEPVASGASAIRVLLRVSPSHQPRLISSLCSRTTYCQVRRANDERSPVCFQLARVLRHTLRGYIGNLQCGLPARWCHWRFLYISCCRQLRPTYSYWGRCWTVLHRSSDPGRCRESAHVCHLPSCRWRCQCSGGRSWSTTHHRDCALRASKHGDSPVFDFLLSGSHFRCLLYFWHVPHRWFCLLENPVCLASAAFSHTTYHHLVCTRVAPMARE